MCALNYFLYKVQDHFTVGCCKIEQRGESRMGDIITKEQALAIVEQFLNALLSVDPQGILALYLIGSLGGGYYRPGQSDIDTLILVRNDAAISQEEIEEIADRYSVLYHVPKGFGAVMVHECELFPPYIKSETEQFEFTVEIARLKTQGVLFYGQYSLEHIPMPTAQDFVKDAKIMENWLRSEYGDPIYEKLDITACVNCILMTMRRFLMIEKSIFSFNKFETVEIYQSQEPAIINEEVFSFIHSYLRGETTGTADDLAMLRRFGTQLSDWCNEKVLHLDENT